MAQKGGISDSEIQKIKEWNIPTISLGKRILRTETAPIVISSIIMYELENYERIKNNERY